MHAFPHIIAVDWLQLFLHDKNEPCENLAEKYNRFNDYEFEKKDYSSRQFREVWIVYNIDGDEYATIQRSPFSSVISKDGAIIKLANRELYKKDYVQTVLRFLDRYGFAFKCISRLDVCFDSTVLHKGLTHKKLIDGILKGKYLKNNQGHASWNFGVQSSANKPLECESCSFGSGSSPVKTKMYNKSKEMREVKDKPYIRELWAENGIDTTIDVWRIEISIKADMTNVVHLSTGETFRLSTEHLKLYSEVQDIFYTYAQKYFQFKVNDGKANKSRMPTLQLFPSEKVLTKVPMRITLQNDTTRADKIFVSKLHKIKSELRDLDAEDEHHIMMVTKTFCIKKGLSEYYLKKVIRKDNSTNQ